MAPRERAEGPPCTGLTILHWYPNLLHGGAVANAVLGLAAAQSRRGARVVLAAATPSRRPLYEPMDVPVGVKAITWRPARTFELAGHDVRLARRRELAKIGALGPDLVHVHGSFVLDNLRVAHLFRCPVVSSLHGWHPLGLATGKRTAKRLYLAAEGLLLRDHIRMFHALCPAEADHLAASFPGAAIYCVPQGPNPLVPEVWPRQAATDCGGERTVEFLFVGRLDVFTKGLDILLEAFGMAMRWARRASLRLTLVGPDHNGGRAWLEQRAVELDLRDRVQFTGPLTGGEIATVLARAQVYVQLSRHDGFPLSVAEALLAAKPAILSTAIGTVSYPEVASLPQVKLVPTTSEEAAGAMIHMAEELPDLTKAALRSREAVTTFFSWDRVARLHLNQYMQLLHA